MFEKYIDYNKIAEDLIKGRNDNLVALESLEYLYKQLSIEDFDFPILFEDIGQNKIQQSAKKTISLHIEKDAINKKIEQLNIEKKLYDCAWTQLTYSEKRILEVFYSPNIKKRQDAVDILCEELEREPATIYRKKDEALNRFKKLLFG